MQRQLSGCSLVVGMLSSHRNAFHISLLSGMLTNGSMQLHALRCSLVRGMLSSHRIEFHISRLFGMLTNAGMQLKLSGCSLVDRELSSYRNIFRITVSAGRSPMLACNISCRMHSSRSVSFRLVSDSEC